MTRSKKFASKHIGQIPGKIVYVGNKTNNDLFLDVFDYNEDTIVKKSLENVEEAFSFEDTNKITWINVNGLNHTKAIEDLGKHFDLHPLIIEDIAHTRQRPKIDEYEDYIFVVLKMIYFNDEKELNIEHVSLILGPDYVISFQESDEDVFDPIRERLGASKGRIRTLGADYLLYSLMDAVVDNYFNLIESFGEKIEVLEDELFENQSSKRDTITSDIQNLKREILKIRRAVFPLREVVNRMEKSDNSLIHEKTKLYLSDLYDHIIQVSESIDIYREMIWGLMDMYMTTISNKMNEIMKVLTIIATIFIPLTFIAGIYGMNFDNIPELKYENGYYVLWGVMLALFIGMLFYFKRKKWL